MFYDGMRSIIAIFAAALLAGCQSTGVIPISSDTYMISKTSAAGMFTNMSALKAEVIREANAFAESKGKVAVAQAMNETPGAPGRLPSFEYQFRLLDKTDPRAQGAVMSPTPEVVIQDARAR